MEVGGVRTEPWIVIHAVKNLTLQRTRLLHQQFRFMFLLTQSRNTFPGLHLTLLLPYLEPYPCDKARLSCWGPWQAGSPQAGLKLWECVTGICREMFLCNVFFCYNRKQGAWVLTIGRGQTKSPFILTIHTFAEVELDGTDFLLKNIWQMTNMLLKSSDEDSFHQTHCLPAGSNSY